MADPRKRWREELRLLEENGLVDAESLLAWKMLAGEACALPFRRQIVDRSDYLTVPASFFEPLPDDLLKLFNGESTDVGED